MNTTPLLPSAPRRRLWPWVLLAVLVTPLVVIGAAAYCYLTLDREAAVLRRQVAAATGPGWTTKVQISVGRFTVGGVRSCLTFVHNDRIDEAKQALAAVRAASVGVYRRTVAAPAWSQEELLARADQAMERRGWTRVVGVTDSRKTVLIYVPRDEQDFGKVCVAVVNPREFVVVAATLQPEALAELIKTHAGGRLGLRDRLRQAKL